MLKMLYNSYFPISTSCTYVVTYKLHVTHDIHSYGIMIYDLDHRYDEKLYGIQAFIRIKYKDVYRYGI